jgi:peptide/nickel transport system permease protein
MGWYLIRRTAWAILLLWFISLFTFILLHLIPGNPAIILAGLNAKPQEVHALYIQLGLNKPLPVQYYKYVVDLLRLNLGMSAVTRDPVTTDLERYLPPTIELVVLSFTIYVILAVTLGAWSATHKGRLSEAVIRLGSVVGSGMPVFWLAALLQLVFFAHLGWLPEGGQYDISTQAPPDVTGFSLIDTALAGQWGKFLQAVDHLVLPVAAIVLAMLAVGLRSTRASVLQELQRPYVRTAKAKGDTEFRIMTVHVLKNALNPVISLLGVQFGYVLGWIALVETVFGWPGIGLYLFNSLQSLDYAPILAITLLTSAVFVVVNLLADLMYLVLDPRLRDRQGA